MKKNLYSLMLSDDVVREVDALAHRMGTNRSALVNQILADYVSVPTPERRINDIFQAIEELVTPSRELVPFFAPNSPTMSLKSSLAYKYRPTVKYELDLNGGGEDAMGDLSVIFRTQSAGLIAAMSEFFRLWVRIEDACLAPLLGGTITCSLYDGRFVRPLAMPRGRASTAEDIAGAISDYVQLFDRLLKGYLGGTLSERDVELAYRGDLRNRTLLI
ncbi:MAG: ribbon-helix-helix domain-containing protein [Dysosmobacter sp.]|nr:ribbon-helix-helix domain-containing protein [Dysosmobacter sp.]